jgi:hypothetical protein
MSLAIGIPAPLAAALGRILRGEVVEPGVRISRAHVVERPKRCHARATIRAVRHTLADSGEHRLLPFRGRPYDTRVRTCSS